MIIADLIWGSPHWTVPAVSATLVILVTVVWSYRSAGSRAWVCRCAGTLKVLGVLALALSLVEPLFSGSRPRPGANLFFLLADNSRSLQIRDRGHRESRGESLQQQLALETPWQSRISQDFDVRRYIFDARLQPVEDFSDLKFDGTATSLANALTTIARRCQGHPTAGVLLLTDGNATDWTDDPIDWSQLPPVYPVMIGAEKPSRDIRVARVSVSQTNFEAAPVTILAEVVCHGFANQSIVTRLLDETDKEVERKVAVNLEDGKPLVHRFQLRPQQPGISFYRVHAFAQSEEKILERPEKSSEATWVNNSRLAMIDRGGGPYRVLYVSGRSNWEFKFLRRSIDEDDEVQLVGLIRVAKREPKFSFRGRDGERTNPIYRGFENQDDEQAEQYDEPVLLRLGTEDEVELRDGFPKAADQLFRYHAIILDDLEAGFFTQEQLSLIQEFVGRRGGGFLMLGGQESFYKGKYRRTPIGELLPVYLDRLQDPSTHGPLKLVLTRDGWVQPWVRIRSTEAAERRRLEQMPGFHTLNPIQAIKPGATVLAHVKSTDGRELPALVVQRFGKGRSSALLIGDMWRWQLRRQQPDQDDLGTFWRQMVRWLVGDVPRQVHVETSRDHEDPSMPIQLDVEVRDKTFEPMDNASVVLYVTTPEGREIELKAEAHDQYTGTYRATFLPPKPGAYRARVVATAADGSEVGQRETGWTAEPASEEFRTLMPNRALLTRIAEKTGGEMIPADGLDEFVSSLPNRKIPVVEPWIYPLWHQWTVFLFAITCFLGEWGLRRWHGLP